MKILGIQIGDQQVRQQAPVGVLYVDLLLCGAIAMAGRRKNRPVRENRGVPAPSPDRRFHAAENYTMASRQWQGCFSPENRVK